MMKTDKNIAAKHRFGIKMSLLHCVLVEICHVTLASNIACI